MLTATIRWTITCLMVSLSVLYLIDVAAASILLVDSPPEIKTYFYVSNLFVLYANAFVAAMVVFTSAVGTIWTSRIWLVLATGSGIFMAYPYLSFYLYSGMDTMYLRDVFLGTCRFGLPLSLLLAVVAIWGSLSRLERPDPRS